MKNFRIGHAFRMAAAFGLFQAFMPVLGWLAGMAMQSVLASVDHWIAFGLLSLIGGKMIYEGFTIEAAEEKTNPFGFWVLDGTRAGHEHRCVRRRCHVSPCSRRRSSRRFSSSAR